MSRARHSRTWSSWAIISSFTFQGRMKMTSGFASSIRSGERGYGFVQLNQLAIEHLVGAR